MNTKPVLTSHPSYEQLFSYANAVKPADDIMVKHLKDCDECQQEIEVIQATRTLLNNRTTNVPQYFANPHLSDEKINNYVYGRLNKNEQQKIDAHLQKCTKCLKEVLTFRTLLAEKNSSRHKETTVLIHKKLNNRLIQFVSLSLAASVFFISFNYLFPNATNHSNTEIVNSTIPPILKPANPFENMIPVAMNGPGVMNVNNGTVNWYGAYVETEAIGTVDMAKMNNPIQAEILAEKAARANAYAQISEILGGVQITQQSTYKDMLMQVDYLNIESQAFIRNAEVINKEIEWIKDTPKVTLKMRVPLQGNDSVQSIVAPHIPSQQNQAGMRTNTTPSASNFKQYTGLVIDSRNSNYQPALHVNLNTALLSEDPKIEPLINLETRYFPELAAVKNMTDIGANPYIVTANKNSGIGKILLNPNDMERAAAYLAQQTTNKPLAVLY